MNIEHVAVLMAKLQAALAAAGYSDVEVVLGDIDNRSTWAVRPEPATEADRAAIRTILDGFDTTSILVPQQVTLAQAQTALYRAGLLLAYDSVIETTTDSEARIAAKSSPYVRRDSRIVGEFAALLGLTAAQVDGLFTSAASIEF